ncbi:hypothetical protein F5146DRAFT_995340 [Armillaria mellea]|nr:hypothetical protein F5146DRAFT_995340 [Armillaria mellea]
MSDIVDHFDDIAPYRNQDEISDTEMSDTHDGQIDKEGSEDGVEEDKEGEQEQDDGQARDGDGDEEAIESRADGEEAEPVQTKDNAATTIAREFIDDLYTRAIAQCTLDHFRSTIVPSAKPVRLQGKRPTLFDEDKLAFQRLTYRFPKTSVQDIEYAFKSYSNTLIDFAETCKKAATITKNVNLEARIRELDKLLFKLHDLEASRSFVNFAIRTIIAIRFAQDYRSWPLSEKKKYHRDLFNSHYKMQVDMIGNQYAGKERDKRLDKLFKTFKGQHEKVVAARNHLNRLYRIFGVTLLLDPFWQLASGLDAPKHSRPFGKIITLLEEDLEPVNDKIRLVRQFEREVEDGFRHREDTPRYNEVNEDAYDFRLYMIENQSPNKKFLLNVIEALGGDEVLAFVKEFVRNPSPL